MVDWVVKAVEHVPASGADADNLARAKDTSLAGIADSGVGRLVLASSGCIGVKNSRRVGRRCTRSG